jgi:hypothetical protein
MGTVIMGEYRIVPYRPSNFCRCAALLRTLWSSDQEERQKYFEWKYHNNPYTEKSLGIVALHGDKVVGFRGYCATPWQAQGKDIMALMVGDTIVESAHRRRGLSMKMGMLACEEYVSDYKFLLNMEANRKAAPGYLKLGFHPLLDKRMQISFAKMDKAGIENVVVSDKPDLQRMHQSSTDKIVLRSDSEFFNWRYKSNIPYKYLFYYHNDDYVVTGQLPKNDTAHILDYTENDISSFEILLKCIRHTPSIVTLSIRTMNLSENVSSVLKKLKFKDNNIKNKLITPILVRPTVPDPVEEDWFLNDLDMRDINNWQLKGICSEWA